MPTNKKKSKKNVREPKKPPQKSQREMEELKLQRMNQAVALKVNIERNLGNVEKEFAILYEDLDKWILEGIEIKNSAFHPILEKNVEWAFHSDIKKYPEIWIRGYIGNGC
jgi:hypothetical protein